MSSSKCSFTCICGIFLNPSTTTVYAQSAFYPSLRFTLSLQSAFYTQSAFYPWSAVCSLQSAVFVLHWPILGARMSATVSACLSLEEYFCSFSNKISCIISESIPVPYFEDEEKLWFWRGETIFLLFKTLRSQRAKREGKKFDRFCQRFSNSVM